MVVKPAASRLVAFREATVLAIRSARYYEGGVVAARKLPRRERRAFYWLIGTQPWPGIYSRLPGLGVEQLEVMIARPSAAASIINMQIFFIPSLF
jgi:hypothetical protein